MNPVQSIPYFIPESVLTVSLVVLIVVNLWKKPPFRFTVLSAITLVVLFLTLMVLVYDPGSSASIFRNQIASDPFSTFFKVIFVLCGIFVVLAMIRSTEVQKRIMGEFYTILLALTLGMFLLVSSVNLLMIYLSLEFVSITSYILTGFKRVDKKASEAALKYVIYGGVASGIMLFGISYFYGFFGTLDLGEINAGLTAIYGGSNSAAPVFQGILASKLTILIACIFTFAGFAYKIAAVPFHMWCPDVYEGAPTPFTAFLSVAPKIAGLAVLCRFIISGFTGGFTRYIPVTDIPWASILGIVSVATMTLGNLSAISQNNIKRLLAYSSIAHCGYLLMGLSALTAEALFAFLFYAVVYLFMNIGAFLVVIAVREQTGEEDLDAYRGMGNREPFLAVLFTIFLFSLTGIPPFAGFIGKFYLFAAVINKAQTGYYLLAIAGILNSVISLYYYVRIVKAMFLEKPDGLPALKIFPVHRALTFLLMLPVIVLGIYWQPLTELIQGVVGRN